MSTAAARICATLRAIQGLSTTPGPPPRPTRGKRGTPVRATLAPGKRPLRGVTIVHVHRAPADVRTSLSSTARRSVAMAEQARRYMGLARILRDTPTSDGSGIGVGGSQRVGGRQERGAEKHTVLQ